MAYFRIPLSKKKYLCTRKDRERGEERERERADRREGEADESSGQIQSLSDGYIL